MFPALQKPRPQAQSGPRNQNPSFQQQIRQPHHQNLIISRNDPFPGGSRLELNPSAHNEPKYNTAVMHPVFFTSSLRKAPFPLPSGHGTQMNPAAHGYIWDPRSEIAKRNDGPRL
ncbi:MAG: hypothetical protein M1834_004187 [Cirrosporium novae-zelandiae]|nr:MAG: hypothetical protein M1834_004187 [Cirrosporium novae-zelandiae]